MNIARMAQSIGQLYDLNRKTTDEIAEQGKELVKVSVRFDSMADDLKAVMDHQARQDEKFDTLIQLLAKQPPFAPPAPANLSERRHRHAFPWKGVVALVSAISASGGLGLWGYLDHRAQMKEKERIARERERPVSAATSAISEGK
jgi:hypothetical protein